MMSSSAGSYASSSALSPAHYRLVQAFEQSKLPSETSNLIANELQRIKSRWERTARSSLEIHHDLVLALYCLSQRPGSSNSQVAYHDDAEWLLVEAVKLAGGEGTLAQRRFGYRACETLFDRNPHSMKLLLINAISSDLHATSSTPTAEIRWTMGLRAVASSNLYCPELVPAAQDRVLELLHCPLPSIRRLSLAALLALIRTDSTPASSPIIPLARNHVLSSLAPPQSPLDSKRSPPTIRSETDARVIAGLVDTLADKLVFPAASVDTVELLVGILSRVTKGEWEAGVGGDVGCPWLSFRVLQGVSRELVRMGDVDISLQSVVLSEILAYVTTLSRYNLAIGLLSSSLLVISHLDSNLVTEQAAQFSVILNTTKDLITSVNPNLRVVAFRCLRMLPVQLWASEEANASNELGEKEWGIIMAGLEDREKAIRREVLLLLNKVDHSLVSIHLDRLYNSLENIALGPTSANQQSHLLSLLLHASSVLDTDPTAWSKQIHRIVKSAKWDQVLGSVVVETIERFRYSDEDTKAGFARTLLDGGEEWKGNLTLALLVAATAGEGSTRQSERDSAITTLIDYLISSKAPFLDLLHEPILLSLLRLVSRLPSPPATLVAQFEILAPHLPSSLSSLAEQFRDSLDTDGFQSLRKAGEDRRSDTLVGFYQALGEIIGEDSRIGRSEAVKDKRITTTDDKLLRYDTYPAGLPQGPRLEGRQPKVVTERRNEQDLERRERGGNGGSMSESLMTAGALVLLVEDGSRDQDSDDEERCGEDQVEGHATADPFLL